jgi:CBS domain containing-hemolysin-like protein
MNDLADLSHSLLMVICFAGTALVAATRAVLSRIRHDSLSAILAETAALSRALQDSHRRAGEFIVATTATRILFASVFVFQAVRGDSVLSLAVAIVVLLLAEFAAYGGVRVNRPKAVIFFVGVARVLTYATFPVSATVGRWLSRASVERKEWESPSEPTRDADDAAEPDDENRERVLEHEERAMIHRILDFPDTQAREVMVPRTDIVALEANTRLEEGWRIVQQSGYSRVPIYEGSMDTMVGVLHLKDLLAYRDQKDVRVADVMRRPILFVPESKRLNDLFQQLRVTRQHLAIVLDEFGQTAGLVTIEDVLEEIVGEIQDEFDVEEAPSLIAQPDGTYLVDGRTPLNDLNDRFGLDLPSDTVTSVGGLLSDVRGRVPEVGEVIPFDGVRIEVVASDDRRVIQVRLSFARTDETNEKESESSDADAD